MVPDKKCSNCKGEMQAGIVVDLNYAGVLPSMWVESQPIIGVGSGAAIDSRRKVKTISYRCSKCGHVDSYAE